MEIKRCLYCGRFLAIYSFHWANRKKRYRQPYCKKCQRNRAILWRMDNPDQRDRKEYNKQWKGNNVDYWKHYAEGHKEYIKKYRSCWAEENRGKLNGYEANRRALKLNQYDPTTDLEKVAELYKLAFTLSKKTLQSYEVDHIIPLSKGGTGHEKNLQIITAHQNRSKHNDENSTITGITIKDVGNYTQELIAGAGG